MCIGEWSLTNSAIPALLVPLSLPLGRENSCFSQAAVAAFPQLSPCSAVGCVQTANSSRQKREMTRGTPWPSAVSVTSPLHWLPACWVMLPYVGFWIRAIFQEPLRTHTSEVCQEIVILACLKEMPTSALWDVLGFDASSVSLVSL